MMEDIGMEEMDMEERDMEERDMEERDMEERDMEEMSMDVRADEYGPVLTSCPHNTGVGDYCGECREVISPRKPRRKGVQQAIQAGVGTGHGRKEAGFCATLTDKETSGGEDLEDDDDEDFRTPRQRKDRPIIQPPPRRVTRSISLMNQKRN